MMNTHKIKSVKSKGLKTSIKFKGLKNLKSLNKSSSSKSFHSKFASFEAPLPGPSASNTSTTRKKDEGVHDLEQQFILRLPPGPSMALRRDVQSAAMNLKDRLSIELSHDMRHGKVTYGGHVFNAKLMDLPCIVESLKTTDRKTFYKTADISQLLLCNMDDDSDSQDEGENTKKKDKEKKYQWNYGITPSLKNVRKRRFRKTLKKKYQEQPEMEKEVKRLFRMDNEAIDIKWEVVIEDDKKNSSDSADTQVLAHGGGDLGPMLDDIDGLDGIEGLPEAALGDMHDIGDIFGELSSSDEDDDERDVNIMDSGDDENSSMQRIDSLPSMDSMQRIDSLQSMDGIQPIDSVSNSLLELNTDTNMSADGGDGEGELHLKLEELGRQLEDIKAQRMVVELELAVTDEEGIKKGDVQSRLNDLMDEENKKQNEYEILSSMLDN